MMKKLVMYLVLSMVIFTMGYYVHTALFEKFADKSTISLNFVYAFLGLFSLILCISFFLLYQKKKFKDQLGFLYLASVVLKIILFSVIFGKQIFIVDSSSPRQAALNLLIPIILTLAIEVFVIGKLLNNSTR